MFLSLSVHNVITEGCCHSYIAHFGSCLCVRYILARHLYIEPKTLSTKPEICQLILPVLITKNIGGEESDEKNRRKRRHRNQYSDGKNP